MKTDIPILLCIHTLIKTWHVALPRKKRKQKKKCDGSNTQSNQLCFHRKYQISFVCIISSLYTTEEEKKQTHFISKPNLFPLVIVFVSGSRRFLAEK